MTGVLLAEIVGPELLIVLLIAALVFGNSKLPKLARSLGSAKSEFAKGLREGEESDEAPAPSGPATEVTMTRAELDALLADREAQARRDQGRRPEA